MSQIYIHYWMLVALAAIGGGLVHYAIQRDKTWAAITAGGIFALAGYPIYSPYVTVVMP